MLYIFVFHQALWRELAVESLNEMNETNFLGVQLNVRLKRLSRKSFGIVGLVKVTDDFSKYDVS